MVTTSLWYIYNDSVSSLRTHTQGLLYVLVVNSIQNTLLSILPLVLGSLSNVGLLVQVSPLQFAPPNISNGGMQDSNFLSL